jgi:hypothetical protein
VVSSSSSRRSTEHGFVTVQLVVAAGCSLALLVVVGNVMVDLYARAVVRAALDEGVDAAVIAASPAEVCETRAAAVVADLLRGAIGRRVRVECAVAHGHVEAVGTATLPGWAFLPDWALHLSARSAVER